MLAVLIAAVSAAGAAAQLDQSCMVSALNRTAPVDAKGVWVLTNVPSGSGQIRVRATCVSNGVTRSGQSSLITVPANGVISVNDISFTQLQAIPASLALTAPTTSLSAAGQRLQLIAHAAYPDGTQADVTAAATGTGYRSSNPAIADVDAAGAVTAKLSGAVVISALNEGALAVLRLQVVLSGSTVSDGIPDDWKVAHGLDPNDPYVAMQDPDRDGLTNLEEYQAGTDPNNPDTDGDGLSDGDEVHLYHTNPLLWDSDGDGISDGVEVRTGSDPLDPTSFNLALALSSVTIDPAAFTLVFNTVYGEASRLLRATGNVIDGRTIDVLHPRYQPQVSYGSSDLKVANFGAEAGRVFAGESGTATVTIAAGGHAATSTVTVRTFSPTAVSVLYLPGFANGIDVAGSFAYVAAGAMGLLVVDASDLFSPSLAEVVPTPGNANWVRVAGGFAYLAAGDAGLVIVDVHNPRNPSLVSQLPLAGPAINLAVRAGLVYVALGTAGLEIVDVSVPGRPVAMGYLALPGEARGVDVSGTLAVVAALTAGVHVVDVANPARPVLLGTTPTRAQPPSAANDVVVRDHWAYVADGGGPILGGIKTIDFEVPGNPVVTGASSELFGLNSLTLDGRLALGAAYYFLNSVPIFDVGLPAPSYVTVLDFQRFGWANGFSIAAAGGAAFMTGAQKDVYQLTGKGTTGTTALYVGLYRITEEQAAAPTAAITGPAPGASLLERTAIPVTVSATDGLRLATVEVRFDGNPVALLYEPPFKTLLVVPNGPGSHTLSVVATNFFREQATAQETVTVVANPAPAVRLLVPAPGLQLTEGGTAVLAADASGQQPITGVDFNVNGATLGAAAAPYRVAYQIPLGTTQLSVTAVARDAFGSSLPSDTVIVPVARDNPPTAAIVQPVDGAAAVEGSQLLVVAGATDDNQVAAVRIYANDVLAGYLTAPPYQTSLTMPPAGQDTRIYAVATDSVGQQTTSATVVARSAPDPLTTVVGRVVDLGGAAVAGATVNVLRGGLAVASGSTAADGGFSIPGVATLAGPFVVTATGTVNGCPATGSTLPLPPAPGGATAVGTVTLASASTIVAGLVLGPDGQPVAGATVQISSGDLADLVATTSGPGGTFAVAGVPARQWPLTAFVAATLGGVRSTGSAASSGAPAPGARTDLGAVLLLALPAAGSDPLTTVTGLVLAADGITPAPGVQVVVDAGTAGLFVAATGAEGSFSIAGVPTTQGSVHVGASMRQACTLFNSGNPLELTALTAGGVTNAGTLVLAADRGPGQIIFL